MKALCYRIILFAFILLVSCTEDDGDDFPYREAQLSGTWKFKSIQYTADGGNFTNVCDYNRALMSPVENYLHKQFILNFETREMVVNMPMCIYVTETSFTPIDIFATSLELSMIHGDPYFSARWVTSCTDSWYHYYRIVSLTEDRLVIGWFRNQAEVNTYNRYCGSGPIDYGYYDYPWSHEVTYTR